MGQEVDRALSDLAATRAALERDVDELFARLPEPAVMAARAKTYGAAAGGTAVVVGALALRQRSASARKRERMAARVNAEELARAFSTTPVPERGGSKVGVLFAIGAAIGAVAAAFAVLRGRSE